MIWGALDSFGLAWIRLDSLGFAGIGLDWLELRYSGLPFGFALIRLGSIGFVWIGLSVEIGFGRFAGVKLTVDGAPADPRFWLAWDDFAMITN